MDSKEINESKEKIKKHEELWNKIKDLIRSITKNSDDYYEKYMKIKFDLDDELPLNKTIEIFSMKTTNVIHKISQMNVCINYE